MSSQPSIRTEGIVCGSCSVPPIKFPSAIAGHPTNPVAIEAADPLEANAVLFMQGARRLLLISFDLLYVSGALHTDLRTALVNRHGFSAADIFLFASHTHFAPPIDASLPELGAFDEAYATRVKQSVLSLVDEMLCKEPSPYRLEVRSGKLSHSVNRRRPRIAPSFTRTWGLSFARVTFGPFERGQRDEAATVITLKERVSQTPLAIIWHYACHPVGHVPANVTSADFPGAVREALRNHAGANLPVLFLQGFCGDVRPNIATRTDLSWKQRFIARLREAIAGTPQLHPTYDAWREWVGSLADKVVKIASSEAEFVDDRMYFSSTSADISLYDLFTGKVRIENMQLRGFRLCRMLDVIAFGAEPSAGWRQRLRERTAGAKRCQLFAGYCGDVYGYLPLPEQVDEGGYEVVHFQRAFGMQGHFIKESLQDRIGAAVDRVCAALNTDEAS